MPKALEDSELPPRVEWDWGSETHSLVSGRLSVTTGYPIVRRRGSNTWLLFYTIGGRGFHRSLDNRNISIGAGDVTLYKPRATQEFGAPLGDTWECHWVHFIARPGWAPWLKLPPVRGMSGLAWLNIAQAPWRRRIDRLFSELHRDLRLGGMWRTEFAFNTIERILLSIGESHASSAGRSMDPRIESVMQLMATRPAESYTLSGLARQVRLSRSRFAHLFRQETGHSMIESLLNLRLEEASKLLHTSPCTVSEIAFSLGFNSLPYFSRQFKRRFGVAPAGWRQRVRQPINR